MSLILDAINRSQRERANPGEVPGVATVHYAEATVAPSAWRQGVIGLALIAGLGALAWWWLGPELEQGATVPPPPAAEAPVREVAAAPEPAPPVSQSIPAPSPAADPVPAITPAQDAASPAKPPASAEVNALYAEAGRAQDAPADSPEAPVATAEQTAEQTAGAAPPAASQAAAPEVEEEPLDVDELVARARAEMRNASLQEHPAPFLAALSQQRKDAIPTLLYSQHDYRGGGRSTVVINGQTAAAGQSLGKGVKVEEILPDSVVLSFGGEPFRLKALNSWVNL